MKPVEAVGVSVWAMASHAGGRQITGCGYQNDMGFTLGISHIQPMTGLSKHDLTEVLQALGIDDEEWIPDGPEGLYEEITFTDQEAQT